LYEVAGVTPPRVVNGVQQIPLEGNSLVYTFDHPNEPSHHHVQYFATNGNRAIYKDGWWAAKRRKFTWETDGDITMKSTVPQDYDIHPWELYNLNDDFSQADDLAGKYPEKVKEMAELFDEEARRNQVYPLLPGTGPLPTPQQQGKKTFIYREGVDRLRNSIAPMLIGMAYTITADVIIPANGARGVILAQGGRYGGFTLFVKDDRVVFEMNAFGNGAGHIVASRPLAAGNAHIIVKVVPDSIEKAEILELATIKPQPGTVTLLINGKAEGTVHFANVNGRSRETLDVGSDLGSSVSKQYQSPNRFTGRVEKVTIQLD
jgi:arylsulfatase